MLISVLDSLNGLVESGKESVPAIKKSLGRAGLETTEDIKSALKATNAMNAQITSTIEELIDSGITYSDNIAQQIREAAAEKAVHQDYGFFNEKVEESDLII